MNNPDLTEEGRLEIKGQIDQLTLEQMKQVNNASGIAIMQMARQNVPVDQSMISTEAPIVDDGSTGAQIETGERKIKPQRFGTKRKTITQDEPKQQPKKKESILTPGLKLKKDKKDDEVDTTEEIKGTTTQPSPGSGGIRGSRGTKKRGTVKVDEQKQEAMIESGDLPVKQASLKENVGEGAITFTKLINNNNMNTAYNSLRSKLNSKASAAILGNIYAENDTFKFNREEEGDINKLKDKERGYGLFQFTNYKDKESGEIVGHRKEYFNYLENTGKEDSIQSQVDYVLDNIYNGVGFNIGETNRETLRESFKNDSVKEIADKFMRIFENPKVKNLDKRSNFGLEAYEYYTTIQDMS
jgi:hypothetical protein